MWWLLGGAALVVGVWAYLAVWPAGRVVKGQVGPHPVSPRIIIGSPFANLVRVLRGKGANDPPSGITLFGRIHVTRGASAFLLCHEMWHWIAARTDGQYRYLWQYVTSAEFRREEEEYANSFARDYQDDGYFEVLT